MARFIDSSVRDSGLSTLASCVRMSLCSAAPVNYADITNVSLGSVAMTSGDYTLEDATGNGRRVRVAQKTITPTATDAGSSLHIVHDDGSKIIAYTDANQKNINIGGDEPIPSHDITMPTVNQS